MKIVFVLGLMALATSSVSSINLTDVIEEEWSLFKVNYKYKINKKVFVVIICFVFITLDSV